MLPPRVNGPYSEKRGFRIRVFDGMGGHEDLFFPTKEEADSAKSATEQTLPKQGVNLALAGTLESYFADKLRQGKCKPATAKEQLGYLHRFLGDSLGVSANRVSAEQAAAMYSDFVHRPLPKTGRPPQVATHRFTLKLAQGFFQWAVRTGYARQNPFKGVQPVGQVNRGKPQLQMEEASKFIEAGLRLYDDKEDVLALAAVTALLLGLRASEVLRIRAQDLNGSTAKLSLAIGAPWQKKGDSAFPNLELPAVLADRLRQRAAGIAAAEPLFGSDGTHKPPCRQLLHRAVHRVCAAAGVPKVCPHSLRSLFAAAGARSGAAPSAVAAVLGYEKPVEPANVAELSVDELLDKLPAATLLQLAEAVNKSAPGALRKLGSV
jgi:integrase